MTEQKIVVIGASAGGVDALMEIARHLPKDLAAPVLVVLHIPAESPSLLPQILARHGKVPAKAAEDGEKAKNGTIYVAPPDRHLLVEAGLTLRLARGPRENRHRPSIDPLFRSAAIAAGPNAIGVILTGSLDDGTAGLIAIKQQGGTAIVQDPDDAVYPSMPRSAIENVDVDACVPLTAITAAITDTVNPRVPRSRPIAVPKEMDMEKKISEMDAVTMQDDDRPGKPSAFSCPECGGVLSELDDDEYVRYRCRVGHAYSPETMLGAQTELLEEALWSALKTLEESARLSHRLADNERSRGHEWMVKRFEDREKDARTRAEVIRQFLATQNATVPIEEPQEKTGRRVGVPTAVSRSTTPSAPPPARHPARSQRVRRARP